MNQLDAAKDAEGGNTDGLDFVISETRIDLLENKVALAVPEGNPSKIDSYDTLASKLKDGSVLLAMGNSDVPVGQYISRRRVELACSRLRENNLNMAEVAAECGFGSRRQFFEVFRQHTGKTPAAYRAESAYVGINVL